MLMAAHWDLGGEHCTLHKAAHVTGEENGGGHKKIPHAYTHTHTHTPNMQNPPSYLSLDLSKRVWLSLWVYINLTDYF